jgi:hypothetical protein
MNIERTGRMVATSSGVAVTASIATCQEVVYADMSGGVIYVPAGTSLTSLVPYAAYERGGTYYPLYDEAGVAISIAVAASRAYPIPASAFGAVCLKFLGSGTGTIYLSVKG